MPILNISRLDRAALVRALENEALALIATLPAEALRLCLLASTLRLGVEQ